VAVDPYPLNWPEMWAKTPHHRRKDSRFGNPGFGQIRDSLLAELKRLGASRVTLTTNLPVRNDGLPYAHATLKGDGDPGAAAYFQFRGRLHVIACDVYSHVWENVKALAKTVEAMRTIQRHGASQLLERAVSGFEALPPGEEGHETRRKPDPPWWEVLGIPKLDGVEFPEVAGDKKHPYRLPVLRMAEAVFKTKVHDAHPDRGGSTEQMSLLNRAIESAREALS